MCTTSDVLKDLTTSLIVRTRRTVCYPQTGMMSWCQTALEIELHVWPMEQHRSRPRERAYSTLCAMWTICRHEANCPLYRAVCTTLSYTSLWKYMFVGSMYEALKDDDRSFGKHFS